MRRAGRGRAKSPARWQRIREFAGFLCRTAVFRRHVLDFGQRIREFAGFLCQGGRGFSESRRFSAVARYSGDTDWILGREFRSFGNFSAATATAALSSVNLVAIRQRIREFSEFLCQGGRGFSGSRRFSAVPGGKKAGRRAARAEARSGGGGACAGRCGGNARRAEQEFWQRSGASARCLRGLARYGSPPSRARLPKLAR